MTYLFDVGTKALYGIDGKTVVQLPIAGAELQGYDANGNIVISARIAAQTFDTNYPESIPEIMKPAPVVEPALEPAEDPVVDSASTN